MKHSEEYVELFEAIRGVQDAVGKLEKNKKNPYHGNTYADLNVTQDALMDATAAHGLVWTHAPGWSQGVLRLDTTVVHLPTGQWLSTSAGAPLQQEDPQGVGSAITYLRRYTLKSIFALADEDDDAEAAVGRSRPAQAPSASQQASQPAQAGDVPSCPSCGGEMWDNRQKKASGQYSANAPDFKCKDKACDTPIWND